jgi:hypothetical protein
MYIDIEIYRQVREWFWQMSYAEEAECVNRIKDFTISESYKIYYAFWDFICSTKPVVRI